VTCEGFLFLCSQLVRQIKMTSDQKYLKYWGKTEKGGSAYHPLVYHSLDVAAVGRLLAERLHIAQHVADLLAFDRQSMLGVITFLCAVHDIGKFSEGFQNLRPDLFQTLKGLTSQTPYQEKHWSLGYRFLCEHTPAKLKIEEHTLLDLLGSWFGASAGHHGRPPKNEIHPPPLSQRFSKQAMTDAIDFMKDTHRLFNTSGCFDILTQKDEVIFKQSSWTLAGLIVLADWLGSNQRWFPYQTDPMDLQSYLEKFALPQAEKAIKESGVLPLSSAVQCSFNDLFPKIVTITPLQKETETLPLASGPKLFIIEEITGAGKTEAALILTQRIMASGEAGGIYFGLPTMATANAMYSRIEAVYRKLYAKDTSPALILAHSANRQYLAIERDNDEQNYSDDDECAGHRAAAWLFDNRKKALLANVGVGTIDQALLSILTARHQSLRLLGLYRKVLIVDEVHAYDSYMNSLLCNLLKFHSAQGGSAILLSATLSKKLRKDFITAFAAGANRNFSGDVSDDYPLITTVGENNFLEKLVVSPTHLHREVAVEVVYERDDVLTLIVSAVGKGKSICWIRNTVYDAFEAYEIIIQQLGEGAVTLFHSRFALGDRLTIEENILNSFGPKSSAQSRSGKVVIATQVVEQSLDLDFDFMISDLAPIDLIIQRAGRLCRHSRDKQGNRIAGKDRRVAPKMVVYMPHVDDEPKSDWYSAVFPKAKKIYEHHGLLWLTAKWLFKKKKFCMPGDARIMIEWVYGDESRKRIPEALMSQENKAEGNDKAKSSLAGYHELKLEYGYAADMNHWPDDEKAPTRIGESMTTVRLVVWKENMLAPYFQQGSGNHWVLSEVSVYRSLITTEHEANKVAIEAVKRTMPDKGKYCVVIPLQRSGNYWEGFARNGRNEKVKVFYDRKSGLQIEKLEENDESD